MIDASLRNESLGIHLASLASSACSQSALFPIVVQARRTNTC